MNDLFFARSQTGMSLAEVTFILLGWGLAQFPHLVTPDVTKDSRSAVGTMVTTIGSRKDPFFKF